MIVFLQFLIGIVYIVFVLLTLDKEEKMIVLNTCNVMKIAFAGIYGILFPICSMLTLLGYNTSTMDKYIKEFDLIEVLKYYCIIFLITISFFVAFKFKNKSFALNNDQDEEENVDTTRYSLFIGIIMLLVGVLSDFLYLRVYGSYENYLNYSGAIRSGVVSVNNPFSFLIVFRSCISISSYIFLSQIKKENIFKKVSFILFCISFILSIRILYSNRGRVGFVFYFAIIVIYIFKSSRKQKDNYITLKTIRVGMIFILLLILGLYLSGVLLKRNSSGSMLTQINKEISFVFADFIILQENKDIINFRYFIDVILFPIYILPMSFWSSKLGITTASSDLTLLSTGFRKGEGGVYGEMPIDLVSLSYIQIGILGIFVIPMVYAWIYSSVLKRVDKIKDCNMKEVIKLYTIINIGIEPILYADPQHIIYGSFSFIVFLMIDTVLSKIKI